jgi:polysaccharide export outer membrane protein
MSLDGQGEYPGSFISQAILRRAFLVVLALVFGAASAPNAIAGSDPYKVGAGDTLTITAYGDVGLSGQFAVGPDGTISYPLLGSVSVANLTTSAIGDVINKAIGQYVAGRTVSVAVSAYAPVFIIGDVNSPGRYEYRPGMIALELIAMSGGDKKGKDVVEGAQVQLLAARQEYADLGFQIFANQVRRARLQAELDGTDFSYPLSSDTDPSEREARQHIVDAEMTLFQIRRDNLKSQQDALEDQRQSYMEEITTIEERNKLHDNELDLMEQQMAATKTLVDRGLTAISNLREAQRQLSAARRDALEMGSFLARAKEGQLDLVQRKQALTEAIRNDAANGIREFDLDTIRKQKQMSAILDRMGAISSSADALQARQVRARLDYVIVRTTADGHQEIKADELTPLRPRDILRATLTIPEEMTGASTASSTKVN